MRRSIDCPEPAAGRGGALIGAGVAALFLALAAAVAQLPAAASPLAAAVAARLAETGLGNPVNAVLLNIRGFDTLLETSILTLALAGLWALSPDEGWGGPPANFATIDPPEAALSVLLRILVPLGAMTAVYLLLLGAQAPGGAFQSGTILASIAILLVLARAMPAPAPSSLAMRCGAAIGFLAFAAAGFLSLLQGRPFLAFLPETAKAFVLGIEVVLTVSIAVSLFLLASGLPAPGAAAGRR